MARRDNGAAKPGARVTAIRRDAGGWQVETTAGAFQGGVVVSEALHKHIALAVQLAVPVLQGLSHSQRSSQPALHALERQAA